MMREMKFYNQRMEEDELVQVKVWVEKKDEEFIKYALRRDRQDHQEEVELFGCRANDSQISFAKELAKANEIPEPKHLYDYHISLGYWILNVITHLGSECIITKKRIIKNWF
jgi:hypothetical protein